MNLLRGVEPASSWLSYCIPGACENKKRGPLCPHLQGRVFAWIDRMLSAQPVPARLADWGPPKDVVARSALTNLLQVSPSRATSSKWKGGCVA